MFAGSAGIANPNGGPTYELTNVDTGRVEIHDAMRHGATVYVGTLRKPFVQKIVASNEDLASRGQTNRSYRAELEVAHPKPILREVFYEHGAISAQKFHDDIWVLV